MYLCESFFIYIFDTLGRKFLVVFYIIGKYVSKIGNMYTTSDSDKINFVLLS